MLDLFISNLPKILMATLVHVKYVIISVTLGSIIAIIIASVLSRYKRLSKYILPIIGIFQTIPGIVFIGVLFVYTGMRPITVYIALTVYAIFPVLKNTYAGILEVDDGLVEAAKGIGMTKWQSLFKVELPMATSAIFTGIRMATVYTVSWAVLAAMIGQGGLGEFIYVGIDTNVQAYILMGAIPAALLAIVMGFIVDTLKSVVTARTMRQGGQHEA
ncbi:ABC transporter permease [Erysipelothrix sp. HDW6C]|uniref:ABC transporter permease n=1 Tax=Erysipelothrix sp. HDW6C TaxID=2714930 RepID=UPI00352C88AF